MSCGFLYNFWELFLLISKKPHNYAFVHTKYLSYLITWSNTVEFPWEQNLWLIQSKHWLQ